MSVNRENVIWQSADGTWSRGFYDFYTTGSPDDEDFDYEWDVDYDYSRFNRVSTGHASKDSAYNSWDGANPGGHSVVVGTDRQSQEVIENLDDMAAVLCEAQERYDQEHGPSRWIDFSGRRMPSLGYHGPRRQRAVHRLFADLKEAERQSAYYQMNGYGNFVNVDGPRDAYLARATNLSPEEQAQVHQVRLAHRDALAKTIEDFDQQRASDRWSRTPDPTWRQKVAAREDAVARLAAVDKKIAAEQAKKTPAKKTPAKKAATKKSAREKDVGVPTTNGGRFAADQRTESDRPLDPPF